MDLTFYYWLQSLLICYVFQSADPTLRSQVTANISRRLNELIYGTSSSYFELEPNLDIWDFEILDFQQYC